MKEMKKYHLAHHYKNFELGYGVTSEDFLRYTQGKTRNSFNHFFFFTGKIWDYVFNTMLLV